VRAPAAASPPWSAESLRLTLFLVEPFDAAGLWKHVVGRDPEVDERRPRESVQRQGGGLEEGYLTLASTLPRLDWVLSPLPVTAPSEVQAPDVGPADAAMKEFERLFNPWLQSSPPIAVKRMAFGLVALLPVPDRIEAYRRLQLALPSVKVDPENSSELFYQINRPKLSRSLAGAKLNRITRWGAMVRRSFQGTLDVQGQHLIAGPETQLVRLECDNSTPADRTEPLDSKSLVSIYSELQEMALDNVERGELA
jgi:hypothetical protein